MIKIKFLILKKLKIFFCKITINKLNVINKYQINKTKHKITIIN